MKLYGEALEPVGEFRDYCKEKGWTPIAVALSTIELAIAHRCVDEFANLCVDFVQRKAKEQDSFRVMAN